MNSEAEQRLIMQRARSNLGEVLTHMPVDRKAAYMEALSRCPHLIETESNPNVFLQFEKFNYWSTAERLAAYWRKRWEYFGERAFLPMDLSGSGAMCEADIKPIAIGCIGMIANSTIIVHDRTAETDNADAATKLRRRFFFMQKLIDPCMRLRQGPKLFIYGFEISDVRRKMNVESKALVAEAFPLPNLEEVHLVFVKERSQTIWQHLVPLGLQQLAGLTIVSNIVIHNFDSMDQIVPGLASYGVSPSNIPVKLGGSFNLECSPFVLKDGLPCPNVDSAHTKNYLFNPQGATQRERQQPLEYQTRIDDQNKNWPLAYYKEQTLHKDTAVKGSLELLLDYFIRKAPDLPDVEEVDSLDPLKPFEPILRSNHISDGWRHNEVPAFNTQRQSYVGASQCRSVPLHLDSDTEVLSEYQCQVRRQIEFFEATDDDVNACIRGRNKAIVLGQVGIRCRHCTHLPRQHRSMAATYFPTKLEGIYQTCQNLARKHLIDSCSFVPVECKQVLMELCDKKSAIGTGKKYWADTAILCGVVEVDNILRFQKQDETT